TRRQEQRGPSRIGSATDQDLTWRELGPMRIKYHADDPLGDPRRHRAAGDGCVSLICGSRPWVEKRSTIAEQQTWHLAPPLFPFVCATMLRNQRTPLPTRSLRQRLDLPQMQEEDIVGPGQYSCCNQFSAARK